MERGGPSIGARMRSQVAWRSAPDRSSSSASTRFNFSFRAIHRRLFFAIFVCAGIFFLVNLLFGNEEMRAVLRRVTRRDHANDE